MEGLSQPAGGAGNHINGSSDTRARFRLPATSANLGPGFDTLALALEPSLTVEAVAAAEYSIEAGGRNRDICAAVRGNLMLHTYEMLWKRHRGGMPQPLALEVDNQIPLGMGCGSSAASRFAGAGLANHFGQLGWNRQRLLDEVTALEHHPDNAAACCLGGFVVSGYAGEPGRQGKQASPSGTHRAEPGVALTSVDKVLAVRFTPPAHWRALLVLGEKPLATTASRAVLPERYTTRDVVQNLQHVGLLTAAFAQGNGALLKAASGDRLHQPFRSEVCPLLPRLMPLAGADGILSVTLSGAGSGILLLLDHDDQTGNVRARVSETAAEIPVTEMLLCRLGEEPAFLHGIA